MARTFNGISDKIEIDGFAAITTDPCTLACWFKPATLNTTDTLISIGNPAASGFWRIHSNAADQLLCQKQNDVGSESGTATVVAALLAIGTWHHCAGVFENIASRTAYLDGANPVNNATFVTDSVATRTSIGVQAGNLGAPTFCDGTIAEVGIWNIALTASEIRALAKGFSPKVIRPRHLVFYAPLVRSVQEYKGRVLVTTGTTVAVHSRSFGS